MQGLKKYCPGLGRLLDIAAWVFDVMAHEVNYRQGKSPEFVLWPYWAWGRINASRSDAAAPWASYLLRQHHWEFWENSSDDGDGDYEDDDEDFQPFEDLRKTATTAW